MLKPASSSSVLSLTPRPPKRQLTSPGTGTKGGAAPRGSFHHVPRTPIARPSLEELGYIPFGKENAHRTPRASATPTPTDDTAADIVESPRSDLAARLAPADACVRVYARLKPQELRECARAVRIERAAGGLPSASATTLASPFGCFSFHGAFEKESNARVYQRVAAPLVRAALSGHNACVMCYGQTGAGKTHTLVGEGPGGDGAGAPAASEGIAPRALRDLFAGIRGAPAEHFEYEVSMQYVQVHNDRIYDLLGPADTVPPPLPLRDDPDGSVSVDGAVNVPLATAADALKALAAGVERSNEAGRFGRPHARSHALMIVSVCRRPSAPARARAAELASNAAAASAAATPGRQPLATDADAERPRGADRCRSELLRALEASQRTHTVLRGSLILVDLAGSEKSARPSASFGPISAEASADGPRMAAALIALGHAISARNSPKFAEARRAESPAALGAGLAPPLADADAAMDPELGSPTAGAGIGAAAAGRGCALLRLLGESVGGNCLTSIVVCLSAAQEAPRSAENIPSSASRPYSSRRIPPQADAAESRASLQLGARAMGMRNHAVPNMALDVAALADTLERRIGVRSHEIRARCAALALAPANIPANLR